MKNDVVGDKHIFIFYCIKNTRYNRIVFLLAVLLDRPTSSPDTVLETFVSFKTTILIFSKFILPIWIKPDVLLYNTDHRVT